MYRWPPGTLKSANQNHVTSLPTSDNDFYPKDKKQQVPARMWRKGNARALLVGARTGAATVENSVELPKKLKIGLLYDLDILLPGTYPKKTTRERTATPPRIL